jgi:acyl-CoA synthetase (AMP-forming)/AMP-acid ligase II
MNRNRSEWDDDTPAERAARLSRAGAPALGVTLSTAPDGELLARSNHVLKSYWDQPEATTAALANDWFHTGDGATIADDNFATITDRKKDVIISGGENVSSIEVEDTLFSHPAVAEVAVIGVPDEKWGETIKALVVLALGTDQQPDERALIEHCREKLAHFKCPTSVEFRDELARTTTGKLQKFKLRAPYWKGMAKQIN